MPSHWSIGEVLALLQADFPEVTISKIRFLESQGLIDPERTPSGYRRFYEGDFERLRWILLQQRDHYLPLKVIKERLDAGEVPDPVLVEAELALGSDEVQARAATAIRSMEGPPADHDPGVAKVDFEDVAELFAASTMRELEQADEQARGLTARPAGPARAKPPADTDALWAALEGTIGQALDPADSAPVEGGGSDVERAPTYSTTELMAVTGCDEAFVKDLERFGLIRGHAEGREKVFDDHVVTVVHLALRFAEHGLGPRHLKAFRLSAEREVGLLSQVIDPAMRRRSPAARQDALAALERLATDGRALHALLMRQALEEEFPDLGH